MTFSENWHFRFPKQQKDLILKKLLSEEKRKSLLLNDYIKKRACIKLSEIDQDVFSSADNTIIFPVDNKCGKQGWTLIEMSKVRKGLFFDALTTAYCEVAPKKLADQIRPNDNE